MEQITLYYREGSSDKVYQASLAPNGSGYVVQFAYGRRGTTLQTGTKTERSVPYPVAKEIYEKLLSAKMAKGYTPGEGGVPYQNTIRADRHTDLHCQLLNTVEEATIPQLIQDPAWWMQQKYDGRRMLIRKQSASITGINRLGLTVALPETLVGEVAGCAKDAILDGEIVGETYFAFDLLSEGSESLTAFRYGERHIRLNNLLSSFPRQKITYVPTAYQAARKQLSYNGSGTKTLRASCLNKSMVPTQEGAPFRGAQLKFKFCTTASFIVGKINAKRSVSLLLFTGDRIRAAGNVTIPSNHEIPSPGQVVECRYLYAFRESGSIYQPVYLGARDDIRAEECVTGQLKFKNASLEEAA